MRSNIAGILVLTSFLIGLGFIVLAMIEGAFSYLSGRLAAFTGEGITRRLRDFLFDHIQRLSFSYHATTPTGDLIERVTSDVDSVRRFFSEQAIGMGRIILLFVINFVAILNLNVKLGLISVIVIPFMLLVSLWFFKKVTKAYEEYQAQEAVLSTTLQENLTGLRVVKAFARQDYEKNKFEKDNWGKFLKGKILLLMHSLFWPLSDIVLGLQMLFGFVYAAPQDFFIGEQGVVLNVKGKGIVVASGCAHRGIVNCVKQAQKITGVEKVHAVLGGFHLTGAKPEVVRGTIADIKGTSPEYIIPTHCISFPAIAAFAKEMPDQFILSTVGTKFTFGG